MPGKTKIQWADATWNPVTGCTKISSGCDHCYAERFAERWRGTPGHAYEQGFDLRLWPERLSQPMRWKKPRMIFVNSMSDLFLKDIPESFIDRVFDVMLEANHHTYQVLTKRSSLMRNYINKRFSDSLLPPWIWVGVSVENRVAKSRIRHLQETRAIVRFISAEPLLEDLQIEPYELDMIDQVIVGGESGPGFRPMSLDWARDIREICVSCGVSFFFKQHSGLRPKALGEELDGQIWHQHPKYLRRQEIS